MVDAYNWSEHQDYYLQNLDCAEGSTFVCPFGLSCFRSTVVAVPVQGDDGYEAWMA